MNEAETNHASDYVELSADLVSAYVSNNSLPASEIGNLLASVHAAISSLAKGGNASPTKENGVEKATPAQIKKSITPDALISFEDGKSYKTLRRHLTIRGLTPEAYRAKYGLPADYPMVSAGYSAQRSELAKALGLGQQRNGASKAAEAKAAQPDETVSEALADAKPKRAGRPRKAVAAE
ncbi:MucR family transcriptional regulator [Methylobacterium sp. J-090]|uniref:MucR family transcriptional regulator n=1 Tax=Methylobacterium sp. J-090 TaxID=2836666 RepID=UPI001FB8DBE5|nr:MucR family transcriptional regulator [Methylobacterium sp. J-090]MCJ2080192.1 MucR family transcriptional regulator [Methylobacterium sp. J-090]